MESYSWNEFVKKIYVKAPLPVIYNLWATGGGLKAWFLREADFIAEDGKTKPADELCIAGDQYAWAWHNWDAVEKGQVLEANGSDTIVFSFAQTKVKVSLTSNDYGTLVELVQSEIPDDDKHKYQLYYGCSNGWTFWMANLKAYAEHGIVLHETDLHKVESDFNGYDFVNV